MMTVEIVKRTKVKKIDLDKADVVKQEVCSRDEVCRAELQGQSQWKRRLFRLLPCSVELLLRCIAVNRKSNGVHPSYVNAWRVLDRNTRRS